MHEKIRIREHAVELDRVGFNSRERLTCIPCGKTLVRQPYHRADEFKLAAEAFLQNHPGPVTDKGWRG